MPTEEELLITPDELRDVVMWSGGVRGIAESTFPHPDQWRLGDTDKPLDRIGVRDLTLAFVRPMVKQPSCKEAWERRLGSPVDWQGVGKRYKSGLGTPKDFGSHFKNILHRSFFTNPHNPKAGSPLCRACGLHRESIMHFGECPALAPVFSSLRPVDGGAEGDVRLNLLGEHSGAKPEE